MSTIDTIELRYIMLYLSLKILDCPEERAVVRRSAGLVTFIPLSDAPLQLSILLLQGANLLQVGCQTIIEMLHGFFFVDIEKAMSLQATMRTAMTKGTMLRD